MGAFARLDAEDRDILADGERHRKTLVSSPGVIQWATVGHRPGAANGLGREGSPVGKGGKFSPINRNG